ncbi:Lysophosphatidylcholine acyltransferase 2 [Acropora cervicornis]|uniref:Lysophosphatidylcholine acyltransferase 2 n=1 Tax=Acropora cervicornis TaxID=6130 RepID=A0AAD9QG52_ACRCE|nr:Lysophosphatidylcholine acyltransferase 2 [Acropora cervicornis]
MSEFPKRRVLLRAKSFIQPEVHNPFTHRLQLTIWDKLKVAVLSFTLFPIRLLCLSLLLLLASFLSTLTTACMKNKEVPQPLSGIRRILRKPLRGVGRAMLFCMGFHWVKVKGKLSKSEEAPILAIAPHSSFIDALALAVICLPSGVSREENDSIPLLGGTCTNRKCLITFKPGAFYTGCPVQPVAIRYPNRLLLPVYKPDTEEIHDGKLFARNVREQVAKVLNVPVTEHSYEDTRLMVQASKQNLPSSVGLIEYEKISTKLSIKLDSMKELLSRFAEIDTDKDGLVNVQEFAQYLNLPLTHNVKRIFSLYDRAFDMNGDGRVEESELRHILQSAHPSITDLDVNCLFNQRSSMSSQCLIQSMEPCLLTRK